MPRLSIIIGNGSIKGDGVIRGYVIEQILQADC